MEDRARLGHCIQAMITTTIRLRFKCDLTVVLLPLDCNLTALRPSDDLRYDHVEWVASTLLLLLL